MLESLYPAHVTERQSKAEAALAACGYDGLILSSGTPFTYFADDQGAPHRATPHFAHWVPMTGPFHLLSIRPGKQPRLVRFAPDDYWYEQSPLGSPFWAGAFDVVEVKTEDEGWKAVRGSGRVAAIGASPAKALANGVAEGDVNPAALTARLDWDRSTKTPYEVACLEEATRRAARGHAAAKAAFDTGASELEIHHAYMTGVGCVDHELPYETIVALDEKGATLHYTVKRTKRDGRVLLIDCGASWLGYGSDITRTWTTTACDPTFRALVAGVDALQKQLCAMVKPGLSYVAIQDAAHRVIGDLLHTHGILKVGGEEAVARGLTAPFFPHGVGHFLGIQVHDVSGRQKGPEGGTVAPPPQYPYLRTTRTITEGQVFTIEPGLYFIEMLLRPYRTGKDAASIDWRLVERLAPFGGIRIEDNVVVTATGHRNLTRPHV